MATEAAELIAKLSLENARFRKQLKEARDKLKEFGDQAEESGEQTSEAFKKSEKDAGQFGKAMKSLKGMIGAAFAAETIIQFGKNIINTTAEFQKMEAVLTNTLGSKSAAQAAMNQITDFASQTPFAVQELTDSFVKLANRGFVPTTAQLRSLGDLASSTGKSFDQLTEAALDAMTGEFERLKEFGIRATAEGDRVQFTFKGVTTEVQKTDAAIKDYILSLGNAEGVTGAMALISETTGGKISNLGDNFTQLFKVIGDSSSGLIAGVLDLSNAIVHHLVRSIDSVNTIAQKTGQGGFKSFLQTLYSLVDPVYATQLEMVATGIKAIEGASFEAMMAGRSFFEAEGKARSEAYEKTKAQTEAIKKLKAEYIKEEKARTRSFLKSTKTDQRVFFDFDKSNVNQVKDSVAKMSQKILNPALAKAKESGLMIPESYLERQKAYAQNQEEINKKVALTESLAGMLGSTFQSAFEGMLNSGKVSFKGIIDGLKALIIKLVAAAAAAAVLAGILAATGLGSVAGFLGNFKKIFGVMSGLNFMAEGGLVTGLTTAVLGDNPSGKEAVIPFERMGSFLSQFGTGKSNMRVEVVGRLSGQDIYFSGLNYSNSQNKIISG
jgi:hypothetical protein